MRWLVCATFVLAHLAGPARAADIDPSKHWAFRPVAATQPPRVKDVSGVRNPIDAFIVLRQEDVGLTPAPEATRRVLARRLSLDLLGLPPSPEEIDAFEKDRGPNAYERFVDRLLASPQNGEKWGRHWLDLARWAESEGYESNHPRPFAWRYRDWVVRAFNDDKPFAAFVREQLAGDEIVPYSDDNLIATGFLAGCRLSSNEESKPRQRNDVLVDIVNATGSVFLGLTVGCAQCHDHKFDPITLTDYYRLQAFFVRGQPGNFALKDPSLWTAFNAACPAEYDPARLLQQTLFERTKARLIAEARKSLSPEERAALEVPPEQRTADQVRLAGEADVKLQFGPTRVEKALPAEDQKLYEELKKKLDALEKRMPARPQTWAFYSPATSPTQVEHIVSKGFYPLPYEPAELMRARAFTLPGGEVARRGTAVEPGWPALFGPTPRVAEKGTRLALADWITDVRHPLTYRVHVNRVWQSHFGRGLVRTSSNFGVTGEKPTHPELLDWLTTEFVRSGGSTKHLHRLIVCSATYRRASHIDPAGQKLDPDNRLLWHWQPRRLDAEAIRDSLLTVSGELNRSAGGPSDPDEQKSMRRAIYLRQTREGSPYMQRVFDGPDAVTESCPKRENTTTPASALFLLNNPFPLARSKAIAERVRRLVGEDDDERQMNMAFLLMLGREPLPRERPTVLKFIAEERRKPAGMAEPHQVLPTLCYVLMNSNEFLIIP
jgi:hypothetical protein